MKNTIRHIAYFISIATLATFWLQCAGGTSPTVSSTTATGKVLTTDSISVTFSEAMDQASVQAAFAITGSDPVPGTFAWTDNTVTFTRESGFWKTNHEYTITITRDAKSTGGTSLAEDYLQTFTPQLNMHDVNGDGIDDFMLGAPRHSSGGKTNNGIAYLFLGKTDWTGVDLSSADATYVWNQDGIILGWGPRVVGDMNGDGYADMVITGPTGGGTGLLMIKYGSATPTGVTLSEIDPANPASFSTLDQLDAFVMGPTDTAMPGFPIMPVGDVNGDGLADFISAGLFNSTPTSSRYWLILGRTEAFPPYTTDITTMPTLDTIANAIYTVNGNYVMPGGLGLPVAACDINDDGYSDMIFGEPNADAGALTEAGKVHIIAGSETPASRDLRTEAADALITGEVTDNWVGSGAGCGDVNHDGYGDVLAGAVRYNGVGRTYLIAGGSALPNVDLATTPAQATYTGSVAMGMFGASVPVIGDVNGDDVDDFLVGAPFVKIDNKFRGMGHLFFGSATPTNVDLGTGGMANATYTGSIPPNSSYPGNASALGSSIAIGDVNDDGVDDILIAAPVGSRDGILDRGIVYLMFGSDAPMSIDFETGMADVTFLGAAAEDQLSIVPGLF